VSANLAFSKKGRVLREIQGLEPDEDRKGPGVRLISYDAKKGTIRRAFNLGPGTVFLTATPDGRIAIIAEDGGPERKRRKLWLVDTETGKKQEIPVKWFAPEEYEPYARISADGRLVSASTCCGTHNAPLVVTVYDWRTKKLVAEQSTDAPAGGLSLGGVTEDGKIQFLSNRRGGEVVDPKTGRVLVKVGPHFYRSVNGAWVVDFSGPVNGETPEEVVIKDGRPGEIAGKLDLDITDDENNNWEWARGAFCGTSGRFVAWNNETMQAFEIPSGKKVAELPVASWKGSDQNSPSATLACSADGKRVAIRSGDRLTLHDLK
jgi:hypothetical protein